MDKQHEERIAFSHRPTHGISIGAKNEDGTLYIAFALTNDGRSIKGNYNRNRRDFFSRKTARKIITGRLDSVISGEETKLTVKIKSDLKGYEFMSAFRTYFAEEDRIFGYYTRAKDDAIKDMIFDLRSLCARSARLAMDSAETA